MDAVKQNHSSLAWVEQQTVQLKWCWGFGSEQRENSGSIQKNQPFVYGNENEIFFRWPEFEAQPAPEMFYWANMSAHTEGEHGAPIPNN